MKINHLAADQARNLVDTRQAYDALLAAQAELDRRFAGSMHWRRRGARDYLYRVQGAVEKSLGPRSPATEATEAAFREGKARVAEAMAGLRERLERIAPVNAALGLGRVPDMVARIVRRLDGLGLLGTRIAIVGTHALYAYEAAAAVQFEAGLLATADVDFALDARRSLSLAATVLPRGLIGALRQVDESFRAVREGGYRAVNRDGFMVDLVAAAPRQPFRAGPRRRLGDAPGDLEAVDVAKLQWLVEAPRLTAVAIAENGLPLRMVVADPRFFAAHKLWLSARPDREPEKRARDRAQGEAVAALLAGPLQGLSLDEAALSQLPPALRDALRAAVAAAEAAREAPSW